MSARLRAESFGRLPLDDFDPRNDEEETERAASAETWILTGGAWKKRKEAAIAAAAAAESVSCTSSAPSSPFRSRVVSKLQPPTSNNSRINQSNTASQRPTSRGRTPSMECSFVSSSDATSTTSRNSSRSRNSKVSEASLKASPIDARRPSLASRQDGSSGSKVSKGMDSLGGGVVGDSAPFSRSSSALSGVSSKGSTVDTSRRSTRTSQTEPARLHSSNSTLGGASAMTSPSSIPVVVKEKKRKTKKSSNAWLKEKDDFFSATRHSESVTRPTRFSGQCDNEAAPRLESRSASSSRKAEQMEEQRSSSSCTRTRATSPAKEDIPWMNASHAEMQQIVPKEAWNDEKKEPEPPTRRERNIQSPLPPEDIPTSTSAKQLRKDRARSTTPRARNAQSTESKSSRHFSPLQRKARERSPGRRKSSQRKLRSPSPPEPLSARELLAQEEDTGIEEVNQGGLPLSHVTAIRQCFGFECDIYRDVLQVGRSSSDRQLRIAYFRRGRNILAEHQQLLQNTSHESPSDNVMKGLSADTKEQFQAVSLAYEIINRPEWRSLYDTHGWEAPLVDFPIQTHAIAERERQRNKTPPLEQTRTTRQERSRTSDPRSRSTTPILRPSVDPDERRSRSAGRGIRWSEQVEELVYSQDPEEMESRRIRSPPPEPETSVFYEDWLQSGSEQKGTGSFMANFLSDLDQSLDGLEASLDGFMGRGFEDWSLSANESKGSASKRQPEKLDRVDRQPTESQVSPTLPSSSSWDGHIKDENDTVPSKLSEQGQGPSMFNERNTPSPEGWGTGGSMTSTLPSTINSLDDSEDMTVKQLFTALTKITDDSRKRDSLTTETESADDRSSPSDVKKMPTQEDEVARAFSDHGRNYADAQPKAQKVGDYFDPFEDSASTINIDDSDFGRPPPPPGFEQVPKKKLFPPRLPVVEDVTSESSTPERSQAQRTTTLSPLKNRPPSPKQDLIFSKEISEFQDIPEDGPLKTRFIDTTSFPRAHSEFSSLTGGTRSVFDNSVKTDHVINPSNSNTLCAPIQEKSSITEIQTDANKRQSNESFQGTSRTPCDGDFLSHLFCYTNALSNDLTAFGNEVSSKLSETQTMILESLTFSDEHMKGVAAAMEMPDLERSNTI